MAKITTIYGVFLATFIVLATFTTTSAQDNPNPPAPDFDLEHSDPRAVALADQVMAAMGGRQAWDQTRYLTWNFFNSRMLWWDKWTGDVRIEYRTRPLTILVNIHTGAGKVALDGALQTDPDTLAKYLDLGRRVWINDSYWLVMPFKLKDSGVTLRYVGESTSSDERPAHIIELTFREVGVTPDNKYQVWIDQETNLVSEWAYFTNYTDAEPRIRNVWDDYRYCGRILLASGRGTRGSLAPVGAPETLPPGIFESP